MTQEEMKQKLHENALDVFVKVQPFYKSTSESESDLQEAKSSAKKLIEKIDDYLETLKPKFKVGDYVSSEILPDGCGIVRLEEDLTNELSEVYGIWYTNYDCEIQESDFVVFKQDTRHATQKEIAEYEAALTFHKHGRKPFKVKEGDLIKYPNGQNIMIYHPDCFSKTDFLNDGFKLIKTAEEVNEWLGTDDERLNSSKEKA